MMTDRQAERMLYKLKRFEQTLYGMLFNKVGEVSMEAFPTMEQLHSIPEQESFRPCQAGDVFEGEGSYCWFKGDYAVPEDQDGKTLYIYPRIDGYEGLLWVNGRPYGNFTNKISRGGHGNHYCDMLKEKVRANESIAIAIEYYAHHLVMGTAPFEEADETEFKIEYQGVDICVRNEAIWDVYFNLRIVNGMAEHLDKNSFRRADIINVLKKVHEVLFYDYDSCTRDEFMQGLEKANALLKEVLKDKNPASAPYAGLVGHSHMDTAWLWDRKQTLEKCARTYANQISLMDQYEDYTFVQSSSYHSAIIKENYPELFEDIKRKVLEGRYEPNGGVWVECDCNIPSGEFMIRQFLWGQRFTQENFNYTSDSFWLPDTFGYSASLPQIMQSCKIKYFLTTKISWCDTTYFPYDTFYWRGLDGSKVLVHFMCTHVWPEPNALMERVTSESGDTLREKSVTDKRLLAYGLGDGGGGPEFEMIELANRLKDVEGLPTTGHTSVSEFMKSVERDVVEPSVYTGELYLELHRGTLTNQHNIKRNNRLAEIAIRNLEFFTVRDAVKKGIAASDENTRPLVAKLLVNQFHDTLPGTCIPSAHDEALEEVGYVISEAKRLTEKLLESPAPEHTFTVANTLSFERRETIYLDYIEGYIVQGDYRQQVIDELDGSRKLAVSNVTIPAFSSIELCMVQGNPEEGSVFDYKSDSLETPVLRAVFDERGYISSLIDKENGRELRGEGYALNTLLMAEDVPNDYDNWDIDFDTECKFRDCAGLISREIVADGEVEFRIRSEYRLSSRSTLKQDMIFYADSKEVVFDTVMNWQDDHRLLKTAFDTTIYSDFARQETQFGYIKRPTTRNTAQEKAKFEVSNHKYTDLSETGYGAALFNDCKYGISVKDSQMRLSLHKGGCRPDYRGDKGIHVCRYAFYPHSEGFNAQSVTQPGYMFNYRPVITRGCGAEESFLDLEAGNIIVETVKPAEDNDRAFILRLYEAEGTYTRTRLSFSVMPAKAELTNMLEEVEAVLPDAQEQELEFHAFEIKTLKVSY